ncbi:hypothetical protein [Phenylobacterium sp.]|uniref:hypothetical protein n=1 Tax=Phenylobacterium sp. TaxID=1871053 RepID=UPI002DE6C183|nr:hypothetical protein [Phenylobacterium sp.]
MIRPLLAGLAATALATAALAQGPAQDAKPAAAAAPQTRSLQGDQSAWMNDPHWRAYYELTRQAFANGPAKVDEAAYQAKAFAIFRDFGVARGVPPEHMVDHLKLIPGQVVKIVREDPTVLASYDNFIAATFGPQ